MPKGAASNRLMLHWPALAVAYARTGRQDKAREILKVLENDWKKNAYVLALTDTELGRHDKAIALLETCLSSHDDRMVWIKVEPRFAPLRSDPKFQAIIANMNL